MQKHRPDNEEVFNALTHGIGAILAFFGGLFLTIHSPKFKVTVHIEDPFFLTCGNDFKRGIVR